MTWLSLAKLFQRLTGYFIARAERRSCTDTILSELATHQPLSGAQLSAMTGFGSGKIYPALIWLEGFGKIVGAWVPGPCPRRRVYRLSK